MKNKKENERKRKQKIIISDRVCTGLAKPKIFTLWTFREKTFANLWTRT